MLIIMYVLYVPFVWETFFGNYSLPIKNWVNTTKTHSKFFQTKHNFIQDNYLAKVSIFYQTHCFSKTYSIKIHSKGSKHNLNWRWFLALVKYCVIWNYRGEFDIDHYLIECFEWRTLKSWKVCDLQRVLMAEAKQNGLYSLGSPLIRMCNSSSSSTITPTVASLASLIFWRYSDMELFSCLRVRAAMDIGYKVWWFVTIPSVPYWLSIGLNMCLLAPRHPPLVSRFLRVSSTWGFVSFGIRATHHVEYGLKCSMGYAAIW